MAIYMAAFVIGRGQITHYHKHIKVGMLLIFIVHKTYTFILSAKYLSRNQYFFVLRRRMVVRLLKVKENGFANVLESIRRF